MLTRKSIMAVTAGMLVTGIAIAEPVFDDALVKMTLPNNSSVQGLDDIAFKNINLAAPIQRSDTDDFCVYQTGGAVDVTVSISGANKANNNLFAMANTENPKELIPYDITFSYKRESGGYFTEGRIGPGNVSMKNLKKVGYLGSGACTENNARVMAMANTNRISTVSAGSYTDTLTVTLTAN